MWVSDTIKSNFEERLRKAECIIKDSGISFCSIGIFGSYARGDYKGHSDIDLCVICDELPDRWTAALLRSSLDTLGVDCTIMTRSRFKEEDTKFMRNLRRDYKEV